MGLFLMHLDDALERQPEFLDYARGRQAHEANFASKARNLRLWGTQSGLDELRKDMQPHIEQATQNGPLVTFSGSGDFHHLSQLIISCLMEKQKNKATIIHFDNHPDWVHFNDGMHCGSWVNKALTIPGVEKVITIGVCSNDLKFPEFKGANLENLKNGKIILFPFSRRPTFVFKDYGTQSGYEQKGRRINWDNISEQENFIEKLLPLITTSEIYITVDKDVLSQDDVITNWDQGKMRLPVLLEMLKTLTKKYNVLGVDVVGDYSTKDYGGTFAAKWKKKLEIMMDQPKDNYQDKDITSLNSASNMELIKVFEENLL